MKATITKLLAVCLTMTATQTALALSFKSSLRQIQLPSTSERKAATFSRPSVPGSMTISGQLYCGDADVEHYVREQSGNFDVINGDTEVITYNPDMSYTIDITSTKQPLYTTVGYWLVPDGQEPLPTKSNFNTVSWGYMAVSPDGSKTLDYFFPATKASDAREDVMQMLRKEVSSTLSLSDKAYGYSSNYRLYMGVFGCVKPMDQTGAESAPSMPSSLSPDDYRPSNADLNYSLVRQNSLDIMAETFRDTNWSSRSTAMDMVTNFNKVSLTKTPDNALAIVDTTDAPPVTFKIDRSGNADLSSAILTKIRDIIQLPYPTYPDYENAVAQANAASDAKRAASDELRAGEDLIAEGSTAKAELDQANIELNNALTAKTNAESALASGTGSQADVDAKTSAYNTALSNQQTKDAAFNDLVSNVNNVLRPNFENASNDETSKRAIEANERTRRKDVYANFMSSRVNAILPSSMLSGDKISKCRDFGLNVSISTKVYPWENFPLNASCKALFEGYLPLQSLYNDLVNPGFFIDEAAQLERKKKLVQNLYLAAAYESAQNFIQGSNSYKMVNHHCFKESSDRSYIDKLVVSYPIKVNYDPVAHKYSLDNTATHLHPEPLFALRNGLSTYAKTMTRNASFASISPTANPMANLNSVYCQIYGDGCKPDEMLPEWKASGFLIPVNGSNRSEHTIDTNTFNVPLNINFKIRGLSRDGFACQGVFFC